ncbi:sce7725 family protein [Halioxenophilus aromaticivorans]|uniref:Sce7725 family protein n=1 Tax=Halioxenophilus aromaticivorans TaxID=1306992 RepID=A0AAV3U8I1_9ALTE
MYYPILRGKQFELIALRELTKLQGINYVTPVIEPVKIISNPFIKTIQELNQSNITPLIIINSTLGEEKNPKDIFSQLQQAGVNYLPCISFEDHHSKSDFLDTRNAIAGKKFALYAKNINEESIFKNTDNIELLLVEQKPDIAKNAQAALNIPTVVIEDGFDKKVKNADYPPYTNFSSSIEDYSTLDLHGFGDYTITGNSFTESGGPAYVVAIHLTQIISNPSSIFSSNTKIIVNHFCSANNGSYSDPAGKFYDALTKLIKFLNNNTEILETSSISEFRKLHKSEHFPGLGAVKKLSMLHHIESILKHIEGS